MPEKYGIETLKSIVSSVAEVVTVGYAVFAEKKGIWQLIGLQGPIGVLSKLDFPKLKLEISDLSEAERESLEVSFKASLPAALREKVGGGVDLLERAIDLIEDAIVTVKKAIEDGKKFVIDAKALLGIN